MISENTEIDRALVLHRVSQARQVTTLCAGRIRPEALEQDDPVPAVVYGVVSSEPWHDLEGASGGAITRVQFNSYAESAAEADRLGLAIEDVLDGFAGRLGLGDEIVDVHDCTLDNNYRRFEQPRRGSRQWLYKRVKDFVVSHSKPLPSLQLE
jgi:hypothetical protein